MILSFTSQDQNYPLNFFTERYPLHFIEMKQLNNTGMKGLSCAPQLMRNINSNIVTNINP